MIHEVTGDILRTDCAALVNPVNTIGIMGAGLARQVKHTFPHVFEEYATLCLSGAVHTGIVIPHLTGTNPRYVISFPTKRHWKNPSQLEWIDQGLISLSETIDTLNIGSIAIPPLGCGLGGLVWADVRQLITDRLGDLTEVDVVLYVPQIRREDKAVIDTLQNVAILGLCASNFFQYSINRSVRQHLITLKRNH